MTNLLTLTVNSTHFYLIDIPGGRLLLDAGWELDRFSAQMRTYHVAFSEIRYVMFTHHHPDHAGLVQNVKELSGAKLIIHEVQIPFLENLGGYYAKKGGYLPIQVEPGDLISPDPAALHKLGIPGQMVLTPGHSEDSLSLLLDSGEAFTGDLPAPWATAPEAAEQVNASWQKLLALGMKMIYPSHTDPIPAERLTIL